MDKLKEIAQLILYLLFPLIALIFALGLKVVWDSLWFNV